MFKVSKKNTRTTCQIYSKLTIKTPKQRLVLLFLTWISFAFYSTVIIADVEQANAGWAWETIVSDNKFVLNNCWKYIVLWAWKICWITCFHPYSPNMKLPKNIFSRWLFKMISRTLFSGETKQLICYRPSIIYWKIQFTKWGENNSAV